MAELTLVLETADGTFVRRIPDASPLPAVNEQGYEVEDASRGAASEFGMPDFVFLPKQQRNGFRYAGTWRRDRDCRPSCRQLADQSRKTSSGDAVRESTWLTKNIGDRSG